jgi:hypothetical protein
MFLQFYQEFTFIQHLVYEELHEKFALLLETLPPFPIIRRIQFYSLEFLQVYFQLEIILYLLN